MVTVHGHHLHLQQLVLHLGQLKPPVNHQLPKNEDPQLKRTINTEHTVLVRNQVPSNCYDDDDDD